MFWLWLKLNFLAYKKKHDNFGGCFTRFYLAYTIVMLAFLLLNIMDHNPKYPKIENPSALDITLKGIMDISPYIFLCTIIVPVIAYLNYRLCHYFLRLYIDYQKFVSNGGIIEREPEEYDPYRKS